MLIPFLSTQVEKLIYCPAVFTQQPVNSPQINQMSYCSAIDSMEGERKALHKAYHDKLYGFPIHDDNELFARLILEINQAGLSWETILKKESSFRKAYSNFNIKKVASY